MTYPNFSVGEVLTAADMNALGVYLVKEQTVGTNVANVSVTSAFSADYVAYRVSWEGGTTAGNGMTTIALNGSTTASHYYSALIDMSVATAAISSQSRNGTVAYIDYMGFSTTTHGQLWVDIVNPFLAKPTLFYGRLINPVGAGGSVVFPGISWGYHNQSTSYTGFTVACLGGNLTGGTIRVYGYKA